MVIKVDNCENTLIAMQQVVFSVCMGVVADISTPAERGVYVGTLVFGYVGFPTKPSFQGRILPCQKAC